MTSAATVNVETSWSAIQDLTTAMRNAANEADWNQVVELAVVRHRDLIRHFEVFPVGPDNAEFYQRHLTAMLACEEELKTLTLDARKRVMRDGLQANQNRRAVNMYAGGNAG